MGYSKNYIMYWGVTSSIIAYAYFCVNTHDSQILQKSLWLFVHFHQIQCIDKCMLLCNRLLFALKQRFEFFSSDLFLYKKKLGTPV